MPKKAKARESPRRSARLRSPRPLIIEFSDGQKVRIPQTRRPHTTTSPASQEPRRPVLRERAGTTSGGMGPPDPTHVLAFWRWYLKTVAWPAAPKAFEGFWGLVASCQPLQRLCKPGVHDPKLLHWLLYHLSQMWMYEGWSMRQHTRTLRTGKRGRPRHVRSAEPSEDFELSLCLLDLIVTSILGRQSKHWRDSAKLLKHFLRTEYASRHSWNRENLRGRVNVFLRRHRPLAREGILRVAERAAYLTSESYRRFITAHLTAHLYP